MTPVGTGQSNLNLDLDSAPMDFEDRFDLVARPLESDSFGFRAGLPGVVSSLSHSE
jgi:hypothetical protein